MLNDDSYVGSGYKYWTLAIVKDTQSIKYKLLTFLALATP